MSKNPKLPISKKINSAAAAGQSSSTRASLSTPLRVPNRPKRACAPLNFKLNLINGEASSNLSSSSDDSSDSEYKSSDFSSSSDDSFSDIDPSFSCRKKSKIRNYRPAFKCIPGGPKRKLYSSPAKVEEVEEVENVECSDLEERKNKKVEEDKDLNESMVNLAKKFLKL